MSALKLRRVDLWAHAHGQATERWRRAGWQAGLGKVPECSGYLHFRAQGDDEPWHGLIGAHDWLNRSLPTLQTLRLRECSLPDIFELFCAVPQPLPLDVEELRYSRLSDIECVALARLPTDDLPWLDTPRGRVWFTRLPPRVAVRGPLARDCWLSQLPLRLALILGTSHLPLASQTRLREGDVLRILQQTQRCFVAGRCLGIFTFSKEGLHMQPTAADASPEHAPGPNADVDLGALPVRLEFVLATHQIDLSTLSSIVDGQLIPLADDAVRHIEVRANGKRVARGELVQLDGHLGVELSKVYRDGGDE
jgi:type III secretion protein Q